MIQLAISNRNGPRLMQTVRSEALTVAMKNLPS